MNRTTAFRSGNKQGLELTRIFVKVIEHGGFTRAAAALALPKSTVSKAIARLERELEVTLLVRTTRAMTATPIGRAYYESCASSIAALESARHAIAGGDRAEAGNVRLTAPEDLGAHVISPAIADLTISHPDLTFEVRYSDDVFDLVRDGFDLAVRIGRLAPSQLYARPLGESTLIAVAAPSYLRRAPRIRSPEDLLRHACLAIRSRGSHWSLRGATPDRRVRLAIHPRIVCNQMTSLLAMAVRGAGVALVPSFICTTELAAGTLERVLPAWHRVGLPVTLLAPLPSSSSARQKLVMDRLATALARALA